MVEKGVILSLALLLQFKHVGTSTWHTPGTYQQEQQNINYVYKESYVLCYGIDMLTLFIVYQGYSTTSGKCPYDFGINI